MTKKRMQAGFGTLNLLAEDIPAVEDKLLRMSLLGHAVGVFSSFNTDGVYGWEAHRSFSDDDGYYGRVNT